MLWLCLWFYSRVFTLQMHTEGGFGIGLSALKHFIEQHGKPQGFQIAEKSSFSSVELETFPGMYA